MLTVVIASACAPTAEPDNTSPDPVSVAPRPADASTVAVDRVLDGDSLRVVERDETFELRLYGINAPESDECGGAEARDTLRGLVGDTVAFVDVDRDQYGRVIAVAWASDVQINQHMVRTGNAVTVSGAGEEPDGDVLDLLIAAQESAMSDGVGLWSESACSATTPRPPVAVTITSPDPPGPDDDALDLEFVTVTNLGDGDILMEGWVLRDESTTNRYRFPPGTRLRAGTSIDVVSGCGSTDGGLAWCAERSIWSNRGDSAFLLDEFGRIVATDRYRP